MVQQLLDEKEEVVKKVMESFVDFSSSYSSSSSGVDDSVREETHVLAVDDSLVDRKVIEKLLKISSCKVTAVDSGKRALELLGLEEEEKMKRSVEGLKIDLIITDYCMPGMTGYELLKKIKESSTFRETPVVIMSSENVVTRIHRCLEEGAEDFIVKPVKLSDVKRLMGCIMMGMQREQQDVVVNVGSKTTIPPKSVVTLNKDNSNINHNKRKQPDEPAATADISTSPDLSSSSPSSSSETSSFMSLSPPESITSSPPQSPSPDQPSSPSLLLPEQSVIDSSPPTEVMQESDDAADQLVLVTPTISAETTASTAL